MASKTASKDDMLREITEVSFAVSDLTLYLDTHPDDQEALAMFFELQQRRKEALQAFEENYYPLTVDCMSSSKNKWTWGDAPAPWEGDSNVDL